MIHFLLGVWIIRNSPSPAIDVFVFQQESSAALLRGENPYKLTFANIYGDLPLYPPDLVRGGRLNRNPGETCMVSSVRYVGFIGTLV